MFKQKLKQIVNRLGYEIKRVPIQPGTHFEIDAWFNQIYSEAQKATQMESTDNLLRRQRHYVLNYLLSNVDLNSGDLCEAGSWRGLSAYQIASYMQSRQIGKTLHIFDSFEGLSNITDLDRSDYDSRTEAAVRKQFACPLETVQENLKQFSFIEFHKGWIPDKFEEVEHKQFCFVHVDVDLHRPIYDTFKFFYPRLKKGGIMVFDDYNCLQFPGAKKAVDRCLEEFDRPFFLPLPSGQAFLIKDR